ncbi:MAG TPA: META domain-containing protein [Candidatus Limnocylindrales bacterium]|nr:META domain-containing protein [Candidatus Limnocylindrales bacterium]
MTTLTRRAVRRAALLASAAAIVLAAAACGPSATPAPSVAPTSAASAGAINLDGTSWVLSDYLSPDGALFTVPAAVTPLAAFKDGVMSGYAGCNTFTASYAIDGDSITLGPAATTKMACAEPMATVENAYLAALAVVDKVAILDNGKLQLWDSGGKTTLAFLKGN